jgi:hypothetical protein
VMSSRALGDRREAATCYAACRQASWRVHHGGATAQRRCGRRSGAGEQHAIATKGQPMERTRQGGGGGCTGIEHAGQERLGTAQRAGITPTAHSGGVGQHGGIGERLWVQAIAGRVGSADGSGP